MGCSRPTAPREDVVDPGAQAPGTYRVRFETSRGPFLVDVVRNWSPKGADRFHLLVQRGYYNEARFFRVIPGFVVQWGIHPDPKVHLQWKEAEIDDDPPGQQSNLRGTITFATRGPNSRTTQVFINLADNQRLDARGFTPFGRVTEGMEVVEALYGGYGDGPPSGEGPAQELINAEGNEYLSKSFPKLDFIRTATVVR
jgi:peptidyl-prolyl cis-trans isomerase A (cyclophilin A)